jgi:hypothetical protein
MTNPTSPADAQRGISYTAGGPAPPSPPAGSPRSAHRQPDPGGVAAIWTWRVWGLADARVEIAATVATVVLLAVSRFALLPSGPWEWDETLFARGLLAFDLPAHFPHPPGFPLWMALGWVMLHVVGNPLLGFQLLSATASCLTFFPLAALGRRVAPAPLAAAAALAALFIPGVWVHAGRGFTDTASAFFALWAAALAVGGLERARATGFTLLVTAAFLIRPILLPPLGLLWLAGALAVRPRRRLLPGTALGLAAIAGATVGLVLAQGSWSAFAAAFVAHAETHARNLVEHNPGGVLALGIVSGFGGPWPTAGASVLALLGIAVWARRVSRRSATAWLVIIAVTVVQLVWLQNRRFPRYAVPLQEAAAPLVAGAAAAAAPPLLALAGVGALGAAWLIQGYPAVAEQHRTSLPGWEAVSFAVRAAKETGQQLVVEAGLYPFVSYQQQLDRRAGRPWRFTYVLAPSSPDSRALPTGTYLLLTDYPFHYGPPLFGGSKKFHRVSDRLRPLTQERFLVPEVAQNVPLPVRGWYLPELAAGRWFRWGAPGAELLLPPVPAGTAVTLEIRPAPGPTPLKISVNGSPAAEAAEGGQRAVWLPPRVLSTRVANRIVFDRAQAYVPGDGDERALAVQLFLVKAVGPRVSWSGALDSESARAALGARAEGVFGPERFATGSSTENGCWTQPSAALWLPAGEGRLRLVLLAARPTPPGTEVFVAGRRVAGPVRFLPSGFGSALVHLSASDTAAGGVKLELRSRPYCPAKEGGGDDTRELGVVLVSAAFTSAEPVPGIEAFRPDSAGR